MIKSSSSPSPNYENVKEKKKKSLPKDYIIKQNNVHNLGDII